MYITEAHAADTWPMKFTVEWPRPRTLAERRDYALRCAFDLGMGDFNVTVDGMDDAFNAAFKAWPTAYYVIDAAGRLLFVGGAGVDNGPHYASFDIGELTTFLRRLAGKQQA